MDIYNLLVYTVNRPIRISLNKRFLKIMRCPFWEGGLHKVMERDMGKGVKNALFIGDILNGCSHKKTFRYWHCAVYLIERI